MKALISSLLAALAIAMSVWASAGSALADSVALGKIQFLVDTNVKMFRFTGTAGQLQSKLDRTGNILKDIELTIPVSSLRTGMAMRDKHMRERVFTTKDGSVPDIVFKAQPRQGLKCAPDCELAGTLTIRGESQPETVKLTMKDPNHVEGTAQILLSKYGIPDPEQLGVKVSDAVAVSFELELK